MKIAVITKTKLVSKQVVYIEQRFESLSSSVKDLFLEKNAFMKMRNK